MKESNSSARRVYDIAAHSPPGRTYLDDSIEASSEDLGGSPHGHEYSAGYESQMATRIGDEEVSDSEVERLRELHEGRHQSDGEHSVRESQRDKKRIAQAICSALPLAAHEREKVVSVVEHMDLTQFGHQKGIPRVTLGVVVVVVDEQHRQEALETSEIVTWSDEFRSICDNLDVSMSDLSTIKETVREVLEEGTVRVGTKMPRRDPALPSPTSADDLPDSYWEDRHSEYWARVARYWQMWPEARKEAMPDKYRDLVERLHQWKPWQETENGEEEVPVTGEEANEVGTDTITE